MFDHDQLRLGVELTYRPRGTIRRFPPGTPYRRVLAMCRRAACRRGIIVLVARSQDEAIMRRHSLCIACEGRTVAEKLEDMTPYELRRTRRRADPIAAFIDDVDDADRAWRARRPTIDEQYPRRAGQR